VDDTIIDRLDLLANPIKLIDADRTALPRQPRDAPIKCR
jgi:hypothetical protein